MRGNYPKGSQGAIRVLRSFELPNDPTAPCDLFCENTEWNQLLSLSSGWLQRDGRLNPLKVESIKPMPVEFDSPPRCKLASAASGSPLPSLSTWQSSYQLRGRYISTLGSKDTKDSPIIALNGLVLLCITTWEDSLALNPQLS